MNVETVNPGATESLREVVLSAHERERALATMRRASAEFYRLAIQRHVHPFVEFAGLINSYIKACERAHADGLDFSQFNAHTGMTLSLESHELRYLHEKLTCIFGDRFAFGR